MSKMISNSVLGIAAGVCSTLFIGYCIYFDHKRRCDPNYKKMIRERRKAAKEKKQSSSRIPPLKDNEAVQRFFLQEVQLGEEMLAAGNINEGVEHLANAVAVCGQPQQLLNVLNTTLPPPVFQLLLQKLSQVGQQTRQQASTGPQILTLGEEDVE